jgi:hypothetical protein
MTSASTAWISRNRVTVMGNGAGRKESMKVEGMQVKSGKAMEKLDVCMKTLVEMGVTADADDRRCRSFPRQRSLPATLECGMPGE